MRVLFFLGSLKFGGAERVASEVASALAGEGVEVHVVIYKDMVSYPLDPRIRLHKLRPWIASGGLLFLIQIYLRLVMCLLRLRPRYAIAPSLLSGVILACTLYPRVITRFDTYLPAIRKRARRRLVWAAFNLPNVRRVVCPSEELMNDVSPYFLQKAKLVRIYNFVEIPSEDPAEPEPYFVSVGRLHPQKQIDLVLQAYASSSLRRTHRYVVVGDGKARSSLEELSQSLGIADRVEFTGNRRDVGGILAKAAFLVSASQKEGFPNVLIEALSAGVPVIAADCKTGPSEIVRHGENGYLFAVGDGPTLRRLLDEVTDGRKLEEIRQNARASVQRFGRASVMPQWFSLLGL